MSAHRLFFFAYIILQPFLSIMQGRAERSSEETMGDSLFENFFQGLHFAVPSPAPYALAIDTDHLSSPDCCCLFRSNFYDL